MLEIFGSLLIQFLKMWQKYLQYIGTINTAKHILFFQKKFRINVPILGQCDLGNPRKLFLIDGLFCGIFQNYE